MITGSSLTHSTFGNLEAVVYRENERRLVHYWRDGNQPGAAWRRAQTVSDKAIGPGCLIQSNYGKPGNFEVIVPEAEGLVHYWHDNANLGSPWQRTVVVAPVSQNGAKAAAATLLQNRRYVNLEMVALILPGRLIHRWCDPSQVWHTGETITERATGPATLLQTTDEDHLELIVPEGRTLRLYFHDGARWKAGEILCERASGAAPGFTQGRTEAGTPRNIEALIPEGEALRQYSRTHGDRLRAWRPGEIIAEGAVPLGPVSLVSGQGDVLLEALVQEGKGTLFAYRLRPVDGKPIWMRSGCLSIDEGAFQGDRADRRPRSEKVAQVTGQRDLQQRTDAFNRTEQRYGIRATDLGASFEHNGRTYLLFGDTHRSGPMPPIDFDAIAYTTDTAEDLGRNHGLNLIFHRSYPRVVAPPVGQKAFEVPADGFSFVDLGTLSSRRFINVSVERIDAEQVAAYRLPPAQNGLLIWGTGAYRADPVRLAFLPLSDTLLRATGPLPQKALNLRYFAGMTGLIPQPRWSDREEDAIPLFSPAVLGEISVRWNPLLKRWALLYCTGPEDPLGLAVCLRISKNPWGPWSRRRLVLDWQRDGLGKYLHLAGSSDGLDTTGKDIGGAAYAPYQLAHHSVGTAFGVTLPYLLSTWNPYQVVLLRHSFPFADFTDLERA